MIQSVWRQRSVANVLKLLYDKARVLQCFWPTDRIKFNVMVYQHRHRWTLCPEGHAEICAKSKRTVASTRMKNQWRTHRTKTHAATRIQTLFRVGFVCSAKRCFIRVCQAQVLCQESQSVQVATVRSRVDSTHVSWTRRSKSDLGP